MISADLGQQLETRLTALDTCIARGIAEADAGRTIPADEIFNRLEAKYRSMDASPE